MYLEKSFENDYWATELFMLGITIMAKQLTKHFGDYPVEVNLKVILREDRAKRSVTVCVEAIG